MPEAMITYMSQPAKVCCDGNCKKAWGINSRPEQDGEYLSDSELGEAPADPGTYEGGQGKPLSPSEFPQTWCVRECERCSMAVPAKYAEPLILKSFDARQKGAR